MKDKRIRMYLIFWFDNKAPKHFKELPTYGISKSGDEFIQLAYAEQTSKKYVDFDKVLMGFLENCKRGHRLIKQLIDEVDGTFNIEIVPEISTCSSTPAIVLNRELIEFINALDTKFGYLEIDTYMA